MAINQLDATSETVVESGVGAYANYQKFGIEGYELYATRGYDSPYFASALREAQQRTIRRQGMYMDAMISSPTFLEAYFGKENLSMIPNGCSNLHSSIVDYNKKQYEENMKHIYQEILQDPENQKRIAEYTKNVITSSIRSSSSYQSKEKKAKEEKKKIESQSSKLGVLKVKEYCRDIDTALNAFLQEKIAKMYEKQKEIDKIHALYCKEHFEKEAAVKAYKDMYTPDEMIERKNIQKRLEKIIVSLKIQDKTNEIRDPKISYNGESAISAINSTKAMIRDMAARGQVKEHLFNMLVELLEITYYQGILTHEKGAERFIVKKPALVDDMQSGADFIVIDPDDKQNPYISYDLKTTMNEYTIEKEIIANRYDKTHVKSMMKDEEFVQSIQADKTHDLANDEIKLRKRRPLRGMYAYDGQKGPVEKYVVPKSILGFPSNLAYTLVAKVMAKVGKGEEITPQSILGLVDENNDYYMGLTAYMQSGVAEKSRLLSPNATSTGYASGALLQTLQEKKKVA